LDPDFTTKKGVNERPHADIAHLLQAHRIPVPPMTRQAIRVAEKRALMRLRMESHWFWNRLKDEVLSGFLSDQEIMVLLVQDIRPAIRGDRRRTWGEVEAVTRISARDVVRLSRSARAKLKQKFPEVVKWLETSLQ
ncbi:MAG: hypothetical protein L0312_14105, partial [Acidobacteria bacterium]|nr:hypothetical protein [Acidobacteriota bacterium]